MSALHKKQPATFLLLVAKIFYFFTVLLTGSGSQLGVSDSDVLEWVYRYRENGELAFLDTGKNNVYSNELKLEAVRSYLNGEGSQRKIVAKYGLRATYTLQEWIKMYNNGEDFSQHMMSGGSRMTTSRKTTKEERVRIVRECLETGCNYGETAIKHNVSYQQVYGWVKRYKELGEAGLEDRRGKRKVNQEPRSEVEKLQIEIEKLKHQLYPGSWREKTSIANKAVSSLQLSQVLQ